MSEVSLHQCGWTLSPYKVKYKEEGKKEMSVNLYSLLADTIDSQHAKELTELQSEVSSGCRMFNDLITVTVRESGLVELQTGGGGLKVKI